MAIISGIKIFGTGGGASSSTPNDGIIRTKAKQLYKVYHCKFTKGFHYNWNIINWYTNIGQREGILRVYTYMVNETGHEDNDNPTKLNISMFEGDKRAQLLGMLSTTCSDGKERAQLLGGRVLIVCDFNALTLDLYVANSIAEQAKRESDFCRPSNDTIETDVEMEYEKLALDPNAERYRVNVFDYDDDMIAFIEKAKNNVVLYDSFNEYQFNEVSHSDYGYGTLMPTWRNDIYGGIIHAAYVGANYGNKFFSYKCEKLIDYQERSGIYARFCIDLDNLNYVDNELTNNNYDIWYSPLKDMNGYGRYCYQLHGFFCEFKSGENRKRAHSLYFNLKEDESLKIIYVNPFDDSKLIVENAKYGNTQTASIQVVENPLYFPIV